MEHRKQIIVSTKQTEKKTKQKAAKTASKKKQSDRKKTTTHSASNLDTSECESEAQCASKTTVIKRRSAVSRQKQNHSHQYLGLLIQTATQKTESIVKNVTEIYKDGEHWIVCDTMVPQKMCRIIKCSKMEKCISYQKKISFVINASNF